MKKILSLVLAVALIICAVPLGVFSFTASAAKSSYYTYSVSNGTATITDVDNSISGDITIPSTLGGYPVTSIGDLAFYNCTRLTSVTIGDSVTSIGEHAFLDCKSLTEIVVSKNNNKYSSQDGALFNKDKTILIQYPIGKINTSYIIPDSVTSIGEYAFYHCESLKSITIPNSVTSICHYAFKTCTGLTNITIPDSVTSIDYGTFSYCTSLTSITIPDSVTSIGSYAFDYCYNLTSITIPDSVTSIGENAFYRCTSLTSIIIPDSVTSIGGSAFFYCESLTNITIPDSVISIGDDAFYNTAYYNDENNWENKVLYISKHLIFAKRDISGEYTIKTGALTIADEAFYECTGLTNITIPDSVTNIGNWAFGDCKSLTSVTIPDSVTSIGVYAFDDCTGLTNITIPNSVTSIGGGAFYRCESLTNITIPDSVTSIGENAFNCCVSLTSITIPNSVTRIGSWAFYGCTGLTSVTIPDSVTSIGERAFYGCTGLTSVTIPDSVTSIGDRTFYSCTDLTNITIPDGVTSIGESAFRYCENLTEVYYTGTKQDRENIKIGDGNWEFTNATWHYNYGKTYPDVSQNAWYTDAVTYAVGTGIMSGYSNGKFGTSDSIQRQDFLVMLARLDGVNLDNYKYKSSFPDVARNSYYEAAVNWGAEKGIVTGYNNGKFGVGDKVTREQLVTFLYRYAKYKGYDSDYSSNRENVVSRQYKDYKNVSGFAKQPILWAIEKGVISGKTTTTIVPQGNAQRCEVAKIMYNIYLNDIFN